MKDDQLSVGVHNSVSAIFSPRRLVAEFDDRNLTAMVVDTPGVRSTEVVVTLEYDANMLHDDLIWIHSVQSGVDRFPLDTLGERGIVLTNSTGIHGRSVAETVLGYVISFARGLHQYHLTDERTWPRPGCEDLGTVGEEGLCVVGLGTLGRSIATLASGVGMEVIGVKRDVEDVPQVETVYPADELVKAVSDARYVVVALPLTDETAGLIDRSIFQAMPAESYLVNVARGEVVDEIDLIAGLESGDIDGAALDVFREEPLPPNSALRDREDVILTPHMAGLYRDYAADVGEIVKQNLDRWEEERDLKNRVV